MTDENKETDKDADLDTTQAGPESDPTTPSADSVIEAFGGIRPAATKLEVAVSTVQGWKARNHIPDNRWRDIIAAADAHGVDLSQLLQPQEPPTTDEDQGEPIEPSGEEAGPWDLPRAQQAEDESRPSESEPASSPPDTPAMREDSSERDPEQPAPPSPKAPPRPPERVVVRRGGWPAWLALLVAVVASAGVLTRPYWGDAVDSRLKPVLGEVLPPEMIPESGTPDTNLATRIEALEQRIETAEADADALASLNERVAALESAPEAGDPTMSTGIEERLSKLEDRVETLSGEALTTGAGQPGDAEGAAVDPDRLASVETALQDLRARLAERQTAQQAVRDQLAEAQARIATLSDALAELRTTMTDHSGTVESLQDSVETLKNRPAIEGAANAGLALSVGAVERAVHEGRPFTAALDRIATLAPTGTTVATAVEKLRPFAETGVASLAELNRVFRTNAAAMHAKADDAGDDWVSRALDGASDLIPIRRTGESPEAPPVSKAEAALERGDLSGALAAMDSLRGTSEEADVWIAMAERRLQAEAALSTLQEAILDDIGVAGGAKAGSDS